MASMEDEYHWDRHKKDFTEEIKLLAKLLKEADAIFLSGGAGKWLLFFVLLNNKLTTHIEILQV